MKTTGLSKEMNTTSSKMLFEDNSMEKIEMGMTKSTAHELIQRLTHLYNKPIEATVREIISNAIDSVKRAGTDRAIEVTLPNKLQNEFIVKDYGEGMSRDTLQNQFVQYGASSKTTDMSQTGAFGLGAKAPLSYCSQFIVSSVKDGIQEVLTISQEEGGNFARFLPPVKTDEPNNTVIRIPVNEDDIDSFKKAVLSYASLSFDIDIKFFGVDFKSSELFDYRKLSTPLILWGGTSDQVELNVYSKYTSDFIDSFLGGYYSPSDVGYSLSGWLYSDRSSHKLEKSNIIVDLVPGTVLFSSSRDEIKDGHRFDYLKEEISKQLASILMVDIQKKVNKKYTNNRELLSNYFQLLRTRGYYNSKKLESSTIYYLNNVKFKNGKKVFDVLNSNNGSNVSFSYGIKKVDEWKSTETVVSDDAVYYDEYNNTLDLNTIKDISEISPIASIRKTINEKDEKIDFKSFLINANKMGTHVVIITEIPKMEKRGVILSKLKAYQTINLPNNETTMFLGTKSTKEEVINEFKSFKNVEDYEFYTHDEFMKKYKVNPNPQQRLISGEKEENVYLKSNIGRVKDKPESMTFSAHGMFENTYPRNLNEMMEEDVIKIGFLIQTLNSTSYSESKYIERNVVNLYKKYNKPLKLIFTSLTSLTKANYESFIDGLDELFITPNLYAKDGKLGTEIFSKIKEKSQKIKDIDVTYELDINSDEYLASKFAINSYQFNHVPVFFERIGIKEDEEPYLLFKRLKEIGRFSTEYVTFVGELNDEFNKKYQLIHFLSNINSISSFFVQESINKEVRQNFIEAARKSVKDFL